MWPYCITYLLPPLSALPSYIFLYILAGIWKYSLWCVKYYFAQMLAKQKDLTGGLTSLCVPHFGLVYKSLHFPQWQTTINIAKHSAMMLNRSTSVYAVCSGTVEHWSSRTLHVHSVLEEANRNVLEMWQNCTAPLRWCKKHTEATWQIPDVPFFFSILLACCRSDGLRMCCFVVFAAKDNVMTAFLYSSYSFFSGSIFCLIFPSVWLTVIPPTSFEMNTAKTPVVHVLPSPQFIAIYRTPAVHHQNWDVFQRLGWWG